MRTGRMQQQQPINPSARETGLGPMREPRLDGYVFGSGGKRQNEWGAGASLRLSDKVRLHGNMYRARDNWGGFGSYEVGATVSIPLNKK